MSPVLRKVRAAPLVECHATRTHRYRKFIQIVKIIPGLALPGRRSALHLVPIFILRSIINDYWLYKLAHADAWQYDTRDRGILSRER